ncbi:probable 26S proteasome subunit YTA6 [Impatiens glandulifera]|uniref:probable 26S proteasome subunit YTA6 n=1 Tax=Impatiens glandulifera TaxID=253017 RepID=UPI001FB19047|nr:probable 26S proteasome subunit YTA6 [Impatiens glandulifera]
MFAAILQITDYRCVKQLCKGILLFGPPEIGKTLIAKALATKASTSFINITTSTLLSEWFGESVKIFKIFLAKTVHGGSRKTTWLKFSWLVFTNDEASNMNELRKWNEKYGQGGSRKISSFGFANQSELLASS